MAAGESQAGRQAARGADPAVPVRQTDGTVLAGEVAKFDALAAQWWDAAGPMRALHAMNPLRVGWIAERVPSGADESSAARGKTRLLDVGCGAGIAAEALARAGLDVLGIDAAADAVAAARAHAAAQGLRVGYRVAAPETLLGEGERFHAVTALEVIEHVTDPGAFLKVLADLLLPGGRLFVTTLNRTARSLLVAKLGAEYVIRMLPVGTHDWRRFITPSELGALGRAAGLRLEATAGMGYDPLRRTWRETRDLSVNYLACLAKPG